MINTDEIRTWWAVFKKDNPLTEIRIWDKMGRIHSGYFTNVETLISEVLRYDGFGIYASINPPKDACYSRVQRDKIERAQKTTSDNDVAYRSTLFIDIDPKRPSDVNSTNEELERAHLKAVEVYKFLETQGFEKPVVAMSSNGYHLYYKIYAANTEEVKQTVSNFLHAIDALFSDESEGGATIDVTVENASRVAKLIGTTSNKGSSTEERPQRLSRFVSVPREFKETDFAYVKKVAAMLPQPEQPNQYNHFRPRQFDLRGFINEHGIEVVKESRYSNGVRFILKECPFDHNHKDAAVFQLDNGALGFSCFHASCSQYHWRDFVLHFDPYAYDKAATDDFKRRRQYVSQVNQEDLKPEKEDERGKKWMQAGEFKFFDLKDAKAIPLGIPELDRKILGLILGEVTIISGGSGAGKTTFINHIILNAVQRNYRVALWSGEMSGGRITGWLDQMAAGKQNVIPVPGTDGLYSVPVDIRTKINDWLGDRLLIYNNSYGQRWSHLSSDIRECIKENGTNLVVVDNLMALTLDSFDGENNDRQKGFINELTDLAKITNTHIILVAHPRKENLSQLIRKESIAGTADITNLAFNVLLLHRTGQDFERRGKEFFGATKVVELMDYDLVVEVSKSRTPGYQDLLVGLYYEQETRRLKNDRAENIIYGWDDAPPTAEQTRTEEDMPDFDNDPYYNKF